MAQNEPCTRFGIIMAGGAGERFWPLSRVNVPKQLLALTHPTKSLLQEAAERLMPLIPADRLFVITGRHLVDPIRDAHIGIPDENVLAEPAKRNTSGALAYATASLLARYPALNPEQMSLAVTTADHFIGDAGAFREAIAAAMRAAEEHDTLAICGIAPTRPETGFGYIQVDNIKSPIPGFEAPPHVFRVESFQEKPDVERARHFLAAGTYFWNSGMFFWRISTFLKELPHARPQLGETIQAISRMLRAGDIAHADALFESIEDISIDYALMEHARHVCMVRGEFPWDDVGSWSSFGRERLDEDGNVCVGDPVLLDCSGCVVYNDRGADALALGVAGLRDMVVVATADALLVLPKARAQEVRNLVQEIKRRGHTQV